MELQYLGTAASEGWPALFCECDACRRARRLGGKNLRTRSQSIVDRKLILDFPPDTYYHVTKYGIDLFAVRHILITHSHDDHFYPQDLLLSAPPFAYREERGPVTVYGDEVVTARLKAAMRESGIEKIGQYLNPVAVKYFLPFDAGEYRITALPANHIPNENCCLYLIEKDGKRLFYAHDTGTIPQKTWDWLSGVRLDAVSLDCNFVLEDRGDGHMGLPNDRRAKEKLGSIGCADEKTKFILNHFSHNGLLPHDELEHRGKECGFLVAYDGMTISV